ncbi:cache domain-containing protein [Marinobacterium sp. D7]|uniref:cache domain-containing protein n=1 Tax=Marinobacterium ramblicola TaxID=2849041 RepID=UPI001C2D6F06|nr:cache domain-containing protein [Marinobacterium ramblicola]
MLKSNLTQRFLLVIFAIIAAIIAAFYLYSVPLIKSKVFEIERNANHIALNNVFELAAKMHSSSREYQEQVLESHRQRLRAVVDSAAFFFARQYELARNSGMSDEEARRYIFQQLRTLTYGEGDYVWIVDDSFTLVSHPDPAYQGRSTYELVDENGQLIIPPVIDAALADGEGFYKYRWSRLNEKQKQEKFSYVKHFPEWHFVIGAGVYIDDVDAEVAARREAALAELREAFAEIKIAKTGYLFIFDSSGRMLVHPNRNIDGSIFHTLKNPVTGNTIMQDLISVADTGKELYYKWDRPTDPGNYVYEKVSLVRYLPGFDWYIGSTIYLEELQASSEVLADRILIIATVALLAASILAFVFVNMVTRPIRKLSETAVRISAGELEATTQIRRDDEIGVLAGAFDRMVDRLRQNIALLDDKVNERTLELDHRNQQLHQAMEEISAASRNLKLVEERQRLILDALPAQIAYVDNQQRYVFVNEGYASAFGLSKPEVIGRHLREIVGPKMYEDIHPQVERALEGTSSTFEYPLEIDGKTSITKRTLMPFEPEPGRVLGLINLSLDITAEREGERRLQAAQRMHTVGQIAGGLSHDFNNLLSILQGNLLAIQDNPATPKELLRHIEPAIRATRRGADITQRLLAFARRQPLSPSRIDLNALMGDCLALIGSSLPTNITQTLVMDDDLWQPLADPGQLEDALVNLAFNARTVMPEGGELRIHISNRSVSQTLLLDEQVALGDYVEISVCDTGCGFSQEGMERAFEPFFTTRKVENSSGLGLSMVYGFVKQSNGYIALSNHTGGGACVTILLPADRRVPESRAIGTGDSDTSAERGLILLLDDEDDLREVVRNQLSDLGYQVIESREPREACELIDSLPELNGLVSDIVMPGGINGYDVARRMRQHHPQSAVVLISGFASRHDERPSDCRLLPLLRKPFTRDQLGRALQGGEARNPLTQEQER